MTVKRPIAAVVPNFSEGRRSEVIDRISAALEVPGASLVYRQADPDHNRLDATVLGAPDAAQRSARAAATVAVELIDMDAHVGSHPRMGAVDVVPFVPLVGVSMDECVEIARGFGRSLAEELDLPVYLYERAALVPERRSLADVRAGGYEALRDAVARGERLPDLGPHRIGKAGATAVGARPPLVAFNLYLASTDEVAAKAIARSVRESGGGLEAVRAIGFFVPERGCVTVSMNLVDPDTTGPRRAFDEVSRLAAERGMEVTDSEIVGLAPASALGPGDPEHVKLAGFDPGAQVLERLLDRAAEDQGGLE
jgi:glutamate formiminotransferase / 5-formyltetrahydrofolate cyclo-ligase